MRHVLALALVRVCALAQACERSQALRSVDAMTSLRKLVSMGLRAAARPGATPQLSSPWGHTGDQQGVLRGVAWLAAAGRASDATWESAALSGFPGSAGSARAAMDFLAASRAARCAFASHRDAAFAAAGAAETSPAEPEAGNKLPVGLQRPNKNRNHMRRMLKRQAQSRVRCLWLIVLNVCRVCF